MVGMMIIACFLIPMLFFVGGFLIGYSEGLLDGKAHLKESVSRSDSALIDAVNVLTTARKMGLR